jgi:hypothetical protein
MAGAAVLHGHYMGGDHYPGHLVAAAPQRRLYRTSISNALLTRFWQVALSCDEPRSMGTEKRPLRPLMEHFERRSQRVSVSRRLQERAISLEMTKAVARDSSGRHIRGPLPDWSEAGFIAKGVTM